MSGIGWFLQVLALVIVGSALVLGMMYDQIRLELAVATAGGGRRGVEMAAGRRLLDAFSRFPAVVHFAMVTPLGWRAFQSFCRGDLSMADVLRRPWIRAVLPLFGA